MALAATTEGILLKGIYDNLFQADFLPGAPAIMIVGFFVIFPLGLNELAKPAFGMQINYGSMIISFIFSIFMLTLAALQLKLINFER